MAQNVNYDLSHPLMEAGLESPADEEGVQDLFNQLIAEQSHDRRREAFELQQLQSELDEEGRDNLAYLSSPQHILRRSNNELSDDEFEGTVDPLVAVRWSSATLRILSSMPSRTIGRSRGAIISQYYNRTMQLRRRRQSRPAIKDFSPSARPSIRGYGMVADTTDGEDAEISKRERLVNNLQNLSAGDRMRMLREMPLSVAEKRELRRSAIQKEKQTDNGGKLPCCHQLKFYIIIIWGPFMDYIGDDGTQALRRVNVPIIAPVLLTLLIPECVQRARSVVGTFSFSGDKRFTQKFIHAAFRQSWYSWLSFLHSLQLWQVTLKRVGGRFGSGVLSYFLFLKKLLFLNLFLFLVMGAFLVLPQAMHPPEPPVEPPTFLGLELLTGAGYFSDTLMYYGYYSNYTLNKSCRDKVGGESIERFNSTNPKCMSKHLSYNMPLAYFFTIGMAFFITCIILVYSMSKSFGQSFRVDKSHSILAIKAFCSWDFKVLKKSSVKLMSENICTQLKELLAEVNHKRVENTACQKLSRLMVHGLAWTICIAGISGSVTAIWYFSDYMHTDLKETRSLAQHPVLKEAKLLTLPLLVSLINLLLPGLFNLTAWMEDYQSPSVRTYVALSRNLFLKMSVLAVLCFHWLHRVAVDYKEIGLQCWESFVGEELYRFLLMDFIFTLLYSLFGELLWRIFSEKVLKRRRKPEFDIAKNVLDLIYGQFLAWLGVLFSPILPAVQILKLLLLFYIKLSSVMMNCQSPRRPYRVSQMTTIFITLLCFPSFLGASVCVTYTMWSVEPSSTCGPFRGLRTMFQAGKEWMKELEEDNPRLSVLARAHTYLVEHPFFLFVGAGIFLIVIYFHSQVVDGQRKIINLLQEQIKNEGEDKKFLITRLQKIHERKRTPAKNLTRQESAC